MSTTCPLHTDQCNPSDPAHAFAHREARHHIKTWNYALLWSPGADPEAQRAALATLESIPR